MEWIIGGAAAVAAIALVVVTGRLAKSTAGLEYVTARLVDETTRAALQAVRPHLVVSIGGITTTVPLIRVTNVGLGAALDIDGTLVFHGASGSARGDEVRRWREHLLEAGEHHDFMGPDIAPDQPDLADLAQIARDFDAISVSGTMNNTLGQSFPFESTVADLQDYRDQLAEVRRLWVEDPLQKLAAEAERLRKEVDELGDSVRKIANPRP